MADFFQGLYDVLRDFENLAVETYEEIPEIVAHRYVEEVYIVDAIDTGRFIQAIDYHEVTASPMMHSYEVDSSKDPEVTYDDIVERGKKDGNYAKGKPFRDQFGGRYPARRAIESIDFATTFQEMMDRIFVHARKGV